MCKTDLCDVDSEPGVITQNQWSTSLMLLWLNPCKSPQLVTKSRGKPFLINWRYPYILYISLDLSFM